MATKIRLSRHGKKGYAFYHIVVTDSRAPRDGKYIEKLGVYNPNTNPATIELNFDRAVRWVGVGAQPTDTTRSILSHEGVMYMHHLNGGVRKGAFTAEVAEQKFNAWKSEKEKQNAEFSAQLTATKVQTAKERMAHETKVKETKAATLAAKLSEAAAAVKVVEAVAESGEEAIAEVIEVAEVAAEATVEAAEVAEVAAEAAVEIAAEAGDNEEKAAAAEAAVEAAEVAEAVEAAAEAVAEEKKAELAAE